MARFDKLLVLDLDETLIHAADTPDTVGRAPEFSVGGYAVYRRPHLDAFFAGVFERFEVGIWTASTAGYAARVVHALGIRSRLRFLWCRDRCTRWFDPDSPGLTGAGT